MEEELLEEKMASEPVEVQLELWQCISVPGPSYRVPVLEHFGLD